MNVFNTFSARLSALFLVLIVAVGISIAFYSIKSVMMFTEEADQKLNRSLASDLGNEFQPLLHHSMDRDSLEALIHYVMGLNPKIEIYLLGSNGMIKASFTDNEAGPLRAVIDTTVLNEFIAGAPAPILGPDPLSENRSKPFSAAHVVIMGEEGCYVYVILGSHGFDSAAAMISDSYIIQGALRMFGLIILSVAIIGLFLFRLMTRRLRAMTEVVNSFEQGRTDRRIDVASNDDLGRLGASFNDMADRGIWYALIVLGTRYLVPGT